MSISLLLDMAATDRPDRVAVISDGLRLTAAELSGLADGGAEYLDRAGVDYVVYVGTGGAMLPVLLFGAARAGLPFCPLNYRLSRAALQELIGRLPNALVIADAEYLDAVEGSERIVESAEYLVIAGAGSAPDCAAADPDDIAVILFTSGTSALPKAVELTHNNLTSYVMGTVEFGSAEPSDGALVCVPPYHIAGVGAALSNLYAGRRLVYLRHFEAMNWIRLAKDEAVTTATVVPTMLDRIVTVLQQRPSELPALRNLAYGGARVGLPLVRAALELLPGVGFVNAYGLTETSSTVAVLTPDDHVAAIVADRPEVARRLGSVGRAVPGIELQIRDERGIALAANEVGELHVRGEQVSGRYSGLGSVLDDDGWFATKDTASIDDDGYLFVHGRQDDTIIRGGENIAPAEIEDVLVEHPGVREVAVVGVEDPEWGQITVAAVVPVEGAQPDGEELRNFVRTQLRGSRTPDRVVFVGELPTTPTGKVLRRVLVEQLRLAPREEESKC